MELYFFLDFSRNFQWCHWILRSTFHRGKFDWLLGNVGWSFYSQSHSFSVFALFEVTCSAPSDRESQLSFQTSQSVISFCQGGPCSPLTMVLHVIRAAVCCLWGSVFAFWAENFSMHVHASKGHHSAAFEYLWRVYITFVSVVDSKVMSRREILPAPFWKKRQLCAAVLICKEKRQHSAALFINISNNKDQRQQSAALFRNIEKQHGLVRIVHDSDKNLWVPGTWF